MRKILCNPDAGRTITGFRDTGYTLNTAIADIIDNCINARADNVWISLNQDPVGGVQIRISDDGYGMNEEDLLDGMRYGSREKKEGNDLGRFGLGLKTASTSMCKVLSVVSRESKRSKLLLARWDIDKVAADEKWNLLMGEPEELYVEAYEEHLSSGTMVCWDKVDRLAEDAQADITPKSLGQKRRRLREHISMIFHRFIEKGKPKIFLDGEEVAPWNPFLPNETTDTPVKRNYNITIPGSKRQHKLSLKVSVIPNKYEYSTDEAFKNAKIQNNLQGFYVYRENRIIIAGDWLQMWVQEPHMSLLRAEISFPRELDELYHLDIKKSHLWLNPMLSDKIKNVVDPIRKVADTRYRQGRKQGIRKKGSPHKQSQGLLDKTYEENTKNIAAKQVGEDKVKIENPEGVTIVEMPTTETKNIRDLIEVVDTIEDGLFWEPAFINERIGVRINRGHPYYEKVYVPNFNDAVTIQGIDSILWALSKCEQEVMSKEIRKRLADIRFYASRALKEVAEELPEVPEEDL